VTGWARSGLRSPCRRGHFGGLADAGPAPLLYSRRLRGADSRAASALVPTAEGPTVNARPDPTRDLAYAAGWKGGTFEADVEITEEEARRRHDAGEQYAVLLGGRDHPDTVVELTLGEGNVLVYFLRPDGRATTTYSFTRPEEGGPLWLEQVYLESWAGEERSGTEWTVLQPDGTMHAERGEPSGLIEVMDDVLTPEQLAGTDLWEPVPEFGDYRSIARFERTR